MYRYLKLVDTSENMSRNDFLPVFADSDSFAELINDLTNLFKNLEFEYIAGIESLGYILASAMAINMQKGIICIRKNNDFGAQSDKAPFSDRFNPDGTLVLRKNLFNNGSRVLIVEEWVATGSQVRTAISLLEKQSAIIAGICGIGMIENSGNNELEKKYACRFLWKGTNCRDINRNSSSR